jgi:hypothetical protein
MSTVIICCFICFLLLQLLLSIISHSSIIMSDACCLGSGRQPAASQDEAARRPPTAKQERTIIMRASCILTIVSKQGSNPQQQPASSALSSHQPYDDQPPTTTTAGRAPSLHRSTTVHYYCLLAPNLLVLRNHSFLFPLTTSLILNAIIADELYDVGWNQYHHVSRYVDELYEDIWKMTANQSYSKATADIRIDITLPPYKKIIEFIRRKYLSKMKEREDLTAKANDEIMNSMRCGSCH